MLYRIDPTVLAPGRMSDKGNVRRSFLWSDGPSVGGELDGKGHCRTVDGGQRADGSFYFFLEQPSEIGHCKLNKKICNKKTLVVVWGWMYGMFYVMFD